jgi:hypothetical protein
VRKVPKHNVSPRVSDIKHPDSLTPRTHAEPIERSPAVQAEKIASFIEPQHRTESPGIPLRRANSIWRKKFISVTLAAIFLTAVSFGIGIYNLKQKLSTSVALGLERFNSAVSDFKVFNFEGAQEHAEQGEAEIRGIREKFSSFDMILAGNFGAGIFPFLKDAGQVYSDIQGASRVALGLVQDLAEVQSMWPRLLKGEGGSEFIASLESLKHNLDLIGEQSNRLISQSNRYQNLLPIDPSQYLSLQVDLGRIRSFLDALIPWLKSSEPHRIAVFLQNPSELRPGGGFIGSYAELIIENGSVRSIIVRDIAYADRELDLKTVPPEPLQALVKNWRAADANWFFDFSVSAQKTLSFIEASNSYRPESITFDGAIGLSADVVSDILEVTGPLTLASGEKITSENFLGVIQKEVQEGHDVGSPTAKKILSEIAPLLVDRLGSLTGESQQELFRSFEDWIRRKDMMVYFKNPAFERVFSDFDATGKPLPITEEWNGDYLAVVNANIGGGKTDVVMRQDIVLQSSLTNEGTVNNHLVVKRTHAAAENDPWYYRMTNQNYLQIFTPPSVQLDYANGGWDRTIKPQVKYEAEGFTKDPEVVALEKTRFEHLAAPAVSSFLTDGKNVFATWSKTAVGATSELAFDYSRRLLSEPADQGTYRFVFEKQSGAKGTYSFEISAPVGFRFKENGLPVYELKTDDPPARLVLDLTLEQI